MLQILMQVMNLCLQVCFLFENSNAPGNKTKFSDRIQHPEFIQCIICHVMHGIQPH